MPKINIKIFRKQCEWKRPLGSESVNVTIILILQSTRKGRTVPLCVINAYGRLEAKVLWIHNVGTLWKWVVSFTLRPSYRRRNSPLYIEYDSGRALKLVWTLSNREKKYFSLPGMESGFLSCPPHGLDTIVTTPSVFPLWSCSRTRGCGLDCYGSGHGWVAVFFTRQWTFRFHKMREIIDNTRQQASFTNIIPLLTHTFLWL